MLLIGQRKHGQRLGRDGHGEPQRPDLPDQASCTEELLASTGHDHRRGGKERRAHEEPQGKPGPTPSTVERHGRWTDPPTEPRSGSFLVHAKAPSCSRLAGGVSGRFD